MQVVAVTAKGLEDLAAAEFVAAGARLIPPPVASRGRVFAEVRDERAAARLLLRLRTVNRVGILVGEGALDPAAPLEDVRPLCRALALDPWMRPGVRFAVRALRQGVHAFRRIDVEREFGGTLHDLFAEAWGAPPRVDLDDPDVLVRIDVDPAHRFVAWVDLVGAAGLEARNYRVAHHPAALKPTMAAALLALAGAEGEAPLVDPVAGSGTIGIEAAWRARGIPPIALRRDRLLLFRAGPLRDEDPESLLPLPPLPDADRPAAPWIRLADQSPTHVEAARAHAARAGVASCIDVRFAGVDRLRDYGGSPRAIVANPPWGIRMGGKKLAATYAHLLAGAGAILGEGGRVALVTPRADLVEAHAPPAGLRILARRGALHGDIPVELLVLAADPTRLS